MFEHLDFRQLVERVNRRLAQKNLYGDLCLVGDSVLFLAYASNVAVKDLETPFVSTKTLREIVGAVAAEHELTDDWLDEGMQEYVSDKGTLSWTLSLSNVKLYTATPEFVFAFKALALARGYEPCDEADIKTLVRALNITSFKRGIEIMTDFFPKERIPKETSKVLKDLLPK